MALLVVIVLGCASLRRLPISLIPDVKIPYITVQATDAGLSAREIEGNVITPLRQQLIQLNGLKDIVCESRDGLGTIKLTFGFGADIDYAFVELNEKIDRAMSFLPSIDRPKVIKASATDIPAFFVNVALKDAGSDTFIHVSRFCKDVISRRIEQLEEVAMVDMSGTVGEEILVLPDPAKLAQTGVTLQVIEDAIKSADVHLGNLEIRDGEYRYNVKFDVNTGGAEDIANTWFRCGDRLLQIKDIADVSIQASKRSGKVRSEGKEAISLAVIKQSDARMSDLKEGISALLESFEQDYPQLEFELTRDQTMLLAYSINNLIWNIVFGVLMACLVVFLFMQDFRSPALICLTIPAALIFSMLVFNLAGLSINIISLSGLLLGVGMMADNTIILIDNITARWNRTGDLRTSVLEGTKEVTGPMLSSVLTTCAVFIPLVFVSGMAGALFYDEAVAVTIVLLTSYIVTIMVIPVYYWWWYKRSVSFRPNPLLQKISLESRLQRWDDRTMKWFIKQRHLIWGLLFISASGVFMIFLFIRKERLPEMTVTEVIAKIDWNDRLSIHGNEERVAFIESVVGEDALHISSYVGAQQFVLSHSGDQGVSEASIYFSCKDMQTLQMTKDKIVSEISARWPGATLTFEPAETIFDVMFADDSAPLTARLRPVRGPEVSLVSLRPLVNKLQEELPSAGIPSVSAKTDVLFVADPERMALYDVSYSQLAAVLQNALNENRLFNIVHGTRSLPVVTGSDIETLSEILRRSFIDKDGYRIPVSSFMRQTLFEDLKTLVSGPEGDYYPVDLDVVSRGVRSAMAAVDEIVRTDGNYEVSYSGSWFTNKAMVREMVSILLIALTLLYLILASQFESLVQPFIILLEVVIDIFGALIVLWTLGVSLNIMSLIGLIVVTGIVINDSILKIDTINRLRKGGMPLGEAVMAASNRRVKAIIMTSLTTILSVSPFLVRGSMGADLQFPMSIVIISGMAVGTLVSLFIVPALYYSLYYGKEHES